MEDEPRVDDTVNILIVDDRPENVLALDATLARPDYNIVVACSGAEALRCVLKTDFAVILLDVLMPGMDGFETAELIRQRERSRHIPIIFLTATGNDIGLIYRGYSVGAVDYLVKPVDPNVVRAKVEVFVDLFRKAQQIKRQEAQLREAERLRNAQALKQRDVEYEATFDDAPIGLAHMTTDGRWLRVNKHFCRIFGYEQGEIIGQYFHDFVHPEDVAQTLIMFDRIRSGDLPTYRTERRYLHKDGSERWASLRVSALDRNAEVVRLIVIAEDVTDRRLGESRQSFLTESSEFLLSSFDYKQTLSRVAQASVVSMAECCIILTGRDEGGDAVCEIAARDPELGKKVAENRTHALELITEAMGRRSALLLEALPASVRKSKGGPHPAMDRLRELGVKSAIAVPFFARGRTLGGMLVMRTGWSPPYDAADLATLEELAQRAAFAIDNSLLYHEAQDAVRARDEFLSIASHELRTPLTPLQIHIQHLLSKLTGDAIKDVSPERMQNMLLRCERQVGRLSMLIDNLLDVSRITSGHLELEFESVDLAEISREVVGRLNEELSRAGCELWLKTDVPAVGVWDRLRLEQVVTNLLGNAIKYGEHGRIEVNVSTDGGTACLSVRDHGIGISEENISKIFDRFERAVSATAYGGLGLGLYITHQIVDAHGGTIDVQSAPGEGSTFTVRLPVSGKRAAGTAFERQMPKEQDRGINADSR